MAAIIVIQNHYHSNIMLDVTVNTPHVTQTQTFYRLIYSVSCHSKYLRVKRGKKRKKTGCTLLLYLSDLFHSFLQDCTFVRLDIEVVDVIEVGEN